MSDQAIWFCKIGEVDRAKLPKGRSDLAMREAVARAYLELTGEEPIFTFSGWAGELTEGERAVVDDVPPEAQLAIHNLRRIMQERRADAS